jgi:hypothetical protein
MEDIKGYMHQFICEHEKRFVPQTYIEKILEVKIKDYDDDHGPMGEHYIVKLEQRVPDFTLTSGSSYKLIESQCLVNTRQFNNFVEKNKAVIWL